MYELIVTEKPNAAKRIAEALAEGKAIREGNNGVYYYKITRGKKDIVVACAVGHLFGVAQKEGKSWNFPVFDIEWKPSHEMSKGASFSKKYLDTIKKLAKDATSFTVATDYDIEGEVIGLNVIRFLCKQKDANRMKFSTLTKPDIEEAYESKSPHLDWGQALAGETRHFLDWYNGINYSRALTSSIKTAGSFKIMSTGRVQGPTLKIIVDREKEIKAFIAQPFWQIELHGASKNGQVLALHEADKFFEKEKAKKVFEKVKDEKNADVANVEKKQFQQLPPHPFDLTTLQIEAYRCFRINPKETLQYAQELYASGFISYPRTSSQQLSDKIGYRKILGEMAKQDAYKKSSELLLAKKNLQPHDGKKTDPAHPAIYPTGVAPNEHNEREQKIYDLIVKRFFATFGDAAIRVTVTIRIDCKQELFVAKGTTTVEKGWHTLYEPYVNLDEEELPSVQQKDKIVVQKIELLQKETQPPKRYTPASIIKELEKRNLGTKSTRAAIVDTLFDRGYVDGKSIEATNLGIKIIETLEQYSPKIVDENLTRHFEDAMEKIRSGEATPETILLESREAIAAIIDDFKKHEKEIGQKLIEANQETREALATLGSCPKCKEGKILIKRGKFGSFAACNRYPECTTTFSLPANALLKTAQKECSECSYPKIISIRRGKRPMEFCLNPDCPTKQQETATFQEKQCPECKEGMLTLRSSIYGKFLGCSKYPKCRYTERLTSAPLQQMPSKIPASGEKQKKTKRKKKDDGK